MNNNLLKVLNPVLFLALLVTIIAMLLYKVPGALQWNETVAKIHEISGIIFFLLGILHIILNRQ